MQFAQANAQTKKCKRACFASANKIFFKKFPNASKKIKTHRNTARQTQQRMTRKLNIDKTYNDTTDRRPAVNRRLAQWRVTWLIEHSTSHQHLWCIDSFVLRNPPLRQAPNRYTQAGVSCFVGQESDKFKVQFFVGSSVVKIPACV